MPGKLYLVATPIGNLGDFSDRAKKILEEADFIAAEDTRVTSKLLTHFGISKPLYSYYEHNQKESGAKILQKIQGGETCALVSDAGTPVINDPGAGLVQLCIEADITVIGIPGPCAAIDALILSGLNAERFTYEGFLDADHKKRREHLAELENEKRTMIIYEAPHHLKKTLDDLKQSLGNRKIALCRELTKLHEEIMRTTIEEACAYYQEQEPRGEYVLVIEGKQAEEKIAITPEQAEAIAREYIAQGMSRKDAARVVSEETGIGRKIIYSRLF